MQIELKVKVSAHTDFSLFDFSLFDFLPGEIN